MLLTAGANSRWKFAPVVFDFKHPFFETGRKLPIKTEGEISEMLRNGKAPVCMRWLLHRSGVPLVGCLVGWLGNRSSYVVGSTPLARNGPFPVLHTFVQSNSESKDPCTLLIEDRRTLKPP